jgi:hypothetical protein
MIPIKPLAWMEMESWVAAVAALIWWSRAGGGVFLFDRRGRKLVERFWAKGTPDWTFCWACFLFSLFDLYLEDILHMRF